MKKKTYLVLTIIGFILPTIFVIIESVETGNILLYANPLGTLNGMFANGVSTIFSIDLFFTLSVFFIWSFHQAKKHNIKHLYVVWLFTLLLV